MLYFAYGSNMMWSQMCERCPSAKFLGIAKLPHHRLAFTHMSQRCKCGVSDVVSDKTESVWGVVYEIAETEIGLLDKFEGYRPGRARDDNSYLREEYHVLRDGDEKHPLLVAVYIVANPQPNPLLPSVAYKKSLVNGAAHWKLPAVYIEKLKRIKTTAS